MLPTTTARWTFQRKTNDELDLRTSSFSGLRLEEQAEIPALGSKDCLVKIVAVSLNYRDIAIAAGKFSMPRTSYVPTSDGAGIVVATGTEVTLHKIRDRVYTLFTQGHQKGLFKNAMKTGFLGSSVDGPLQKYAIYTETGLVPMPLSLSFSEAATLPCAALTAWNALFGLAGRTTGPGDWILTQGTGGVSLFASQFALAAGAKVIQTTSSDAKAQKLKALGVEHVVNYKKVKNWGEKAREVTGGDGVAHVIEVGGEETIPQSFKAIKEEGVISFIGFLGTPERNAHDSTIFQEIWSKVAILRAIQIGSREQAIAMNNFIDQHLVKPVLDERRFEFEQVREAFHYMREQAFVGKVLVHVSDEKD